MKKRLFADVNLTPTDELLRKQLGVAFQYYDALLQASGGFRRQWQFSRGNGWILKIDDTRKALYYLITFDQGIEVSLTVSDAERQYFINNPKHGKLQFNFEIATKYPEGYALRFGIESMESCKAVSDFLSDLIKQRGSEPLSPERATWAKASDSGVQQLNQKKIDDRKSQDKTQEISQ